MAAHFAKSPGQDSLPDAWLSSQQSEDGFDFI